MTRSAVLVAAQTLPPLTRRRHVTSPQWGDIVPEAQLSARLGGDKGPGRSRLYDNRGYHVL